MTAPTLDQIRQQANLAFLASNEEFSFGNAAACPMPPAVLAQLSADSACVKSIHNGGLTAVVFELEIAQQRYALKIARRQCLVRNVDGETSFLNELQRHAEIAALRLQGVQLSGVIAPIYGSLKHGILVSPWIDGAHVREFSVRQLQQVLQAGLALAEHGFFEWDYSPGNLLDDGEQVWLFDFGYMYRFDPLTQLNSAAHGVQYPQFHVAERIEARSLFANLLDVELVEGNAAALAKFCAYKQAAIALYSGLPSQLSSRLKDRGASQFVLNWFAKIVATWTQALAHDAASLYLHDGWRAHTADLHDDISGKSCTPRTITRAQWLMDTVKLNFAQLQHCGALSAADAALSQAALIEQYAGLQAQAYALQTRD